jgi:hypothetical protein
MASFTDKIHLFYFPIAGRAEVARMIIKYNNLDAVDSPDTSGEDMASYLTKSAVPILRHGDLKMNQSLAIENYLMSICERYKDMTKAQIAKDQQISAFKEDLLALVAGPLFGGADKEKMESEVNPKVEEKLALLEGILPAEGYVNGLPFPTLADFAIYNMYAGYMPFGAFIKKGGNTFSFDKYPKFKAIAEATRSETNYEAETLTAPFGGF